MNSWWRDRKNSRTEQHRDMAVAGMELLLLLMQFALLEGGDQKVVVLPVACKHYGIHPGTCTEGRVVYSILDLRTSCPRTHCLTEWSPLLWATSYSRWRLVHFLDKTSLKDIHGLFCSYRSELQPETIRCLWSGLLLGALLGLLAAAEAVLRTVLMNMWMSIVQAAARRHVNIGDLGCPGNHVDVWDLCCYRVLGWCH